MGIVILILAALLWREHDRNLLIKARVAAIYYAAVWHPDRDIPVKVQAAMWSKLRDACGFTPGQSSKPLASH
jgi:hypothetical protein